MFGQLGKPKLTTGLPDDYRALEPPDPIPNSEVKRCIADGSVAFRHVRVGHRQASNKNAPNRNVRGVLLCATFNPTRSAITASNISRVFWIENNYLYPSYRLLQRVRARMLSLQFLPDFFMEVVSNRVDCGFYYGNRATYE
jgi:hypothetical protein